VVGIGLLLAGCQATRAGYESAPYKVVGADGKFELRDYPALGVVETPMANANGSDGSFMRLFRLITGGNEAEQKIAMTPPDFKSGRETNATMAFVSPRPSRSRVKCQAGGCRRDWARTGGGTVRGAALQRRAQCGEGSGIAG